MKNRKIIIILLLLVFCILIIIKVGINGTTSSGIGMNLTNNGSIPNMLDSEHLSATNEDVVKEEVFQEIKKIYNTIDFKGTFKQGDLSKYNIYKKKYNQFLKGERFIIDNVTGEKLYLWESEFWNCNVQLYTYYFFDMDGDENPELCIKDEVNTLYIIKYEEELDEIILWLRSVRAPIYLLGTGKLTHADKNGSGEAFIQLSESGEWEYSVWFKKEIHPSSQGTESEYWYLVSLPYYYTEKSEEMKISDEIKQQGIFNELQKMYYYRVTEEQYDELTEKYTEALNTSMKDIRIVTFTYEELFSEL